MDEFVPEVIFDPRGVFMVTVQSPFHLPERGFLEVTMRGVNQHP